MAKQVFILLIIWVIFGTISLAQRIPSYAGPYRAILRKVGNESDEFNSTGVYWIRLYCTHPKLNVQQYVWGWIHNTMPITNEHKLEIRMSQWSGNQWKRNAFVMKFDKACSTLFFHARSLLDLGFLPQERKCPLPKLGLREIRNQSFDAVFPQFPVLPYGRYLFTMAYIKHGVTTGVVAADIDLVPKLSRQ